MHSTDIIPDFLHVYYHQAKSYPTIINLTPLAALRYGDPVKAGICNKNTVNPSEPILL